MGDLSSLRWRTGRKVGRTIYAQPGPEPSDDDVLIGTLDTPALAAEAVAAHNTAQAVRLAGAGVSGLPDGAYELADAAFENWRGHTDASGVERVGPCCTARDELEAALLAAMPVVRAAELAPLREALRAHTHSFTDHAGVELCGGCLRPSPCPDAVLAEEPK